MKAIAAPSITLLLAWSAVTATPSLRFSNNDTLAGSPQSIDRDKLVWQSPLLEKPAEFPTTKIEELSLPASIPEGIPDHEAIVTLTNGDSIRGQLASITDELVTLDTWFAGRLNLNRMMVTGVKIEETGTYLYRGPSSLEDWIQSTEPPAWTFSQSSFQSMLAGGIARDDLLSDECAIHFDVLWKGDSIRLRTIVFSDDPTSDNPGSGYEISFQRGRVHLRNLHTQNFLGSAQSRALMENDRASIEIRASAKTHRIALLINDEVIEVWNDPDAGNKRLGTALHFITGSNLPTKISNIRVTQWDGVMDRMPEPQVGFRRFGMGREAQNPPAIPAQEDSQNDRMELANGDSLPGEVVSITEGIITMQTPLGEINLPVARLRSVALKPVDAERCKRYNGDVRAWFPDGDSIVFRLESGDRDKLQAFSQNFGHATFKASAFSRIEFNIHSPEYQQRSAAEGW